MQDLRLTMQHKILVYAKINRIKAVLAEQNRTSKWLAEQLGRDQATISKWCTNTYQPSLEMLVKIAEHLNVDVRDLIVKTEIKKVNV